MGKKKRLYEKKATKVEKERARVVIGSMLGRELEARPDLSDLVSPKSAGEMLYKVAERGATLEEIASYRYEVLKAAVSYLQLPNRSQLTRKIEMAEAIHDHAAKERKHDKKPKAPKALRAKKKPKASNVQPERRKTLPSWLR